uniref:G-protein coupled receptors family 1 profile domain-containing protein n=1 Tax=Denticeps clupeoides TaxID=299321 RepID=A0AAY4EH12_9TELE
MDVFEEYTLDGDSNYSDYYDNQESLENFGLCHKKHLRKFGKIFLPVFYFVVCILSVVTNVGMIVIFLKNSHLRRPLAVGMVISDLLFSLTLPFWAVYAHEEWIFGQFACKTVTLVYTTTLYSGIFFTACMNLHRYLDVVCLLSFLRMGVKLNVMCAVVWVLALLASTPHVTFVEVQHFQGQQICTFHLKHEHSFHWKIFMRLEMNIAGFLVPLLVMLFCSVRMANMVKKTGKRSDVFIVEFAFVGLFFVLWFPYNIVLFLHALQELHIISDCSFSNTLDLAVQLTESFAFTHAFLHPFLYGLMNRGIWKCLKIRHRKDRSEFKTGTSSHAPCLENDVELTAVN